MFRLDSKIDLQQGERLVVRTLLRPVIFCVIIITLMACNRGDGDRLVIAQKIQKSLENYRWSVTTGVTPFLVREESIELLKAVDVDALHCPIPLPSYYGQSETNPSDWLIVFNWMEASPTLTKVILVNPDTGAEMILAVDAQARARNRDIDGIVFGTTLHFPRSFLGSDVHHKLRIYDESHKRSAPVYPDYGSLDVPH